MKRTITAGRTAPDEVAGRGGWLSMENPGQSHFPLFFERRGVIRARVIGAEEPLTSHAVLVTGRCAPLIFISPEDGEVSEPIGEEGDWIQIYRAGAKTLICRVFPGSYGVWQASELSRYFPGCPDELPED